MKTTVKEKYGERPFVESSNHKKVKSALFQLTYGKEKEKVRDAFFFLTTLNDSFQGHKIIDLVPENKKFKKTLKEKCLHFEKAFLYGKASLSKTLFEKPV